MSEMSPTACPVCGSIGTRRFMLDHIDAEHPGRLSGPEVLAAAQAIVDLYVIPQDGVTDATAAINRNWRADPEMRRALESLRTALTDDRESV